MCWICLGEQAGLMRPCACPRFAHPHCLARWQLQSAGSRSVLARLAALHGTVLLHQGKGAPYLHTAPSLQGGGGCQGSVSKFEQLPLTLSCNETMNRRETHCEFCDCQLPDWKKTLTPQCGANAPAVMNVNFDGRTYSFEVLCLHLPLTPLSWQTLHARGQNSRSTLAQITVCWQITGAAGPGRLPAVHRRHPAGVLAAGRQRAEHHVHLRRADGGGAVAGGIAAGAGAAAAAAAAAPCASAPRSVHAV